MRTRRPRAAPVSRSAFAGFRFPADVIVVAVRWYLRLGLSYRNVEELLAERGVDLDHVTVYRWVQRFTPLLADARGVPEVSSSCRPLVFVDQPTEDVTAIQLTKSRRARCLTTPRRHGRAQAKAAVRAEPVVVLDVDAENANKLPGADDQQLVQTLPAAGPRQSAGLTG